MSVGCVSSIEHERFKRYQRKVPACDIVAIEGQSVDKLGEILQCSLKYTMVF